MVVNKQNEQHQDIAPRFISGGTHADKSILEEPLDDILARDEFKIVDVEDKYFGFKGITVENTKTGDRIYYPKVDPDKHPMLKEFRRDPSTLQQMH
jgi:hypothetical protein